MALSPQLIAEAIQDNPDLAKAVQDLVATHPDTGPVITRLLNYIQSQHQRLATSSGPPDSKRPKLETHSFFTNHAASMSNNTASAPVTETLQTELGPAIYSTTPLSFLHPVRKKLILSLYAKDIALVSATNPADVLCRAPYTALHRAIAVPFLERTTKQTAVIFFFRHASSSASSSSPQPHNSLVPVKDAIWAVPLPDDGKDFTLQFQEQNKALAGLSEDLKSASSPAKTPIPISTSKKPDHTLMAILSYFLQRSNPSLYDTIDLILNPTSTPYPYFSAHLKSNQGTIYLLPTGMLFAFRKPLLFLPSKAIEAVGVHSVLSRTFDFEVVMDLNVAKPEDLEGVPPENKDGRRAIGFGMVDTKEFGRMEEWIKKSGIRDRSMSEDLKAKDKAPTSSTAAGSTGSKKRERPADGEEGADTGASLPSAQAGGDDDDDDEEDEDFAPESEDEEMVEEYDEDAEGSDDEQDGEGPSQLRTRGQRPSQDEESLGEESLGEEDEDSDDQEDEEDSDEENGEDEVDELQDD